jgi:secondary thiamine-phosphate synthase enzyme
MQTTTFAVHTGVRATVHDITRQCEQFARESAAGADGLVNVFVPHATAGLAILELGSGSDADLLTVLDQLLPAGEVWRHAHGSRGHGRSHVLPAFVPPTITVPVVGGQLALGTWQSIAVVDLNVDNPDRQVRLSFVS